MTETKEIMIAQPQGLEALGTTELMKKKLADNSEKLRIVHDFISENFRQGIDYGPADPRNPKDTLLKAGAERLCKLFNTRPVWRRDRDTWEMLGSPAGTVCLICEIVDNATGYVIGEGRGAETVGNKKRDSNKVIKAAEKCALVDAVLYTFGLSERFTQDLKTRTNLNDEKRLFAAWVTELRTRCTSTMTTNVFIQAVIKQHLKKSEIQTIGELDSVRMSIERGDYDLETGELIK